MYRSLVYSTNDSGALVELSLAAEEAGFHRLWVTENVGHDALVQAAALVEHTTSLRIGTGIAYAFSRTPVALAIAAQNLAHRSEGRFTLGIGAGTRGLRHRYGVEFDHPAPRLVEYAELMREIWTGAAVSFKGKFYQAELPGWGQQTSSHVPAVYGSGLNALMLKYAAAGFDGVALHPLTLAAPYFEKVAVPSLRDGANQSGKQPALAAWVLASMAETRDEAYRQAARALAFYFATPSYRNAAEGASWESAAAAIRERFAENKTTPDWGELAGLVPLEMIDDLAICGTPDDVGDSLKRFENRLGQIGIDELVLQAVSKGTAAEAHAAALSIVRHLPPVSDANPTRSR